MRMKKEKMRMKVGRLLNCSTMRMMKKKKKNKERRTRIRRINEIVPTAAAVAIPRLINLLNPTTASPSFVYCLEREKRNKTKRYYCVEPLAFQ